MIVVNLYLQTSIVIHVGQNQQRNISSTSNISPFDNNIDPFININTNLFVGNMINYIVTCNIRPIIHNTFFDSWNMCMLCINPFINSYHNWSSITSCL